MFFFHSAPSLEKFPIIFSLCNNQGLANITLNAILHSFRSPLTDISIVFKWTTDFIAPVRSIVLNGVAVAVYWCWGSTSCSINMHVFSIFAMPHGEPRAQRMAAQKRENWMFRWGSRTEVVGSLMDSCVLASRPSHAVLHSSKHLA